VNALTSVVRFLSVSARKPRLVLPSVSTAAAACTAGQSACVACGILWASATTPSSPARFTSTRRCPVCSGSSVYIGGNGFGDFGIAP
jgi:hypothetical protein